MDLNEDEIIQILKIIDASDFDELCLETADQKLVLRKKGGVSSLQELQTVNLRPETVDSPKGVVSEKGVSTADHAKNTIIAASVDHAETGLVPVKAPVFKSKSRERRQNENFRAENSRPGANAGIESSPVYNLRA